MIFTSQTFFLGVSVSHKELFLLKLGMVAVCSFVLFCLPVFFLIWSCFWVWNLFWWGEREELEEMPLRMGRLSGRRELEDADGGKNSLVGIIEKRWGIRRAEVGMEEGKEGKRRRRAHKYEIVPALNLERKRRKISPSFRRVAEAPPSRVRSECPCLRPARRGPSFSFSKASLSSPCP